MVDGKKLGSVGFQYLGVPYSKMDCQAFVEQCLKDCGENKNLTGSNAWFREVYKNGEILTPEECVKKYGSVPSGAFLFILKNDGGEPEKYKPDGLGNATHIGLCTGSEGEGAIHSSSSRGCVAESKFNGKSINGGWNRVGLWDHVDYGNGQDEDNPPMRETAVVCSKNGGTVKMRAKPSASCKLYWDVPNGATVDLLEWKEDWSHIAWDGKSGYMMSEFLVWATPAPPEDEMVLVPKYKLMMIYDLLGELLDMEVG